MKRIPGPKLLTYQKFMKRINQIDIGKLHYGGEILCHGLGEEDKVDWKFRNRLQLLLRMASLMQTKTE